MAKDKEGKDKKRYTPVIVRKGNQMSGLYGLGFIGALIYFLHYHSGTFWLVILAILKAFVWPALLVYHLFQVLQL
jgi:hypothetical protein